MTTRIFKNAKVYSIEFDDSELRAEAIVVKDDVIEYIGTFEEAEKYIDKETEVIDCHGGSLLPGFGDAHMHIGLSHKKFAVCDVSDAVTDYNLQTPQEVIGIIQEKLKKFYNEHPNAQVIRGIGWDRFWFSGDMHGLVCDFDKKVIDDVISDKPVVLDGFDGHITLLNSKALEAANIDSFDDPGNLIERDKNGVATGIIKEPVMMTPVCNAIPGYEFGSEDIIEGLQVAQKVFAEKGYTYLSDLMQNETSYKIIKEMAQQDKLTVRIDGVFNCNNKTMDADFENAIKKRDYFNVKDLFKVDTVKYFADGEMSMIEPLTPEYCEAIGAEKGFRYPLLWDKNDLAKSMEEFQKEGFNIHVHSMGNYSTQETIDCIEQAQKYNDKGLRNAIAHCSFVTDRDKKRMGDLKIIASIQPEWQYESNTSSPALANALGLELHKTIYPSKSFEDNGVISAYGSDFPVYMPNAFSDIQTALTRRANPTIANYNNLKDVPAEMPEECITLKQAIKNHTINVAYQFHRDDITGSLKVGKSADFVVLSKDIENVPTDEIYTINIVETVFKGKTTYKR